MGTHIMCTGTNHYWAKKKKKKKKKKLGAMLKQQLQLVARQLTETQEQHK